MGKLAVFFGMAMIAFGVVAYLATGFASVTALIPAFFGLPIFFCGVAALKPNRVGFAGVAALVLAFVGLGGSMSRIVPALAGGQGFTLSVASGVQLAFGVMCLVFLACGIVAIIKRPPKHDQEAQTAAADHV